MKSAWFTEQVSGYPGLHTEKPYITKKKTKRGRRRKRRKKRMKRMKKRRRKKRRRGGGGERLPAGVSPVDIKNTAK